MVTARPVSHCVSKSAIHYFGKKMTDCEFDNVLFFYPSDQDGIVLGVAHMADGSRVPCEWVDAPIQNDNDCLNTVWSITCD